MNFDQKVADLYLNLDSESEKPMCMMLNALASTIRSYDEKYWTLLGLRASVIKWHLIETDQINPNLFRSRICGACLSTTREGLGFECVFGRDNMDCPVYPVFGSCCFMMQNLSSARVSDEIFKLYMAEHKKFEKTTREG